MEGYLAHFPTPPPPPKKNAVGGGGGEQPGMVWHILEGAVVVSLNNGWQMVNARLWETARLRLF